MPFSEKIKRDPTRIMKKYTRLFLACMSGANNLPVHYWRGATDVRDGSGHYGETKTPVLDEPSMGLAPLMVKTIFEVVKDIK